MWRNILYGCAICNALCCAALFTYEIWGLGVLNLTLMVWNLYWAEKQ